MKALFPMWSKGLASRSRIPAHVWVALSAWGSRIVTAATQLASVRVLLDVLGPDRYAAFVVILSLLGWYQLSDFGIGFSVQNYISEHRTRDEDIGDLLVTAGVLLFPVAVFFLALVLVLGPWLGPHLLGQFSILGNLQKTHLFWLSGILFLANAIGSIAYKIWFAEQRGWWANIAPAIASVCALALLYACGDAIPVERRLTLCVVVYNFPASAIALSILVTRLVRLVRQGGRAKKNLAKSIVHRAFGFWSFTLLATAVLQVDYIIMSQRLATSDIVAYNVGTKIFGLVTFLFAAILQALWPVCAEAAVRRDSAALTRHLRQYLAVGFLLISLFTAAFILLKVDLVRLLAHAAEVQLPTNFIIVLGLYHLLRVWSDTFAMFLQSMNYLRPLWFLVPAQAVISMLLQWYLTPRWGMYGVTAGLAASFLLTVAWGLPLALSMRIRKLKSENHA